jgi:O-antigen ligase
MKETAIHQSPGIPFWAVLILALIPVAAVLGFLAGETLPITIAVAGAVFGLALLGMTPLSIPVKLIFVLVGFSFLQKVFGYIKFGEVRGINIGNILLLLSLSYWLLRGLGRGQVYRPTPIDPWLLAWAILVPLTSIFYTVAYRKVPGFTLSEELVWYKQWVTPPIYFFLFCQCVETRQDIRRFFRLLLALIGLVVLAGLPEVLQFANWRGGRSQGAVQQPNDYAALLACISPFFFLIAFLLRDRLLPRVLAIVLLGFLAISILTTYSRAGYVGFGLALVGSAYLAFRSTGRLPFVGPVLVLGCVGLLPVVAAPQILDYVEQRFEMKTYKRAARKSYSEFGALNQYSGDRLELWTSALEMAQDSPLFGVGFHAYPREVPKYHSRGVGNYPHNQFLGALAEGGVVWLTLLLVLLWRTGRLLFENWLQTVRESDVRGEVICGGALVGFTVMLWTALSNDFFNPGPKSTIFWVVMAAGIMYGLLPRDREEPAA